MKITVVVAVVVILEEEKRLIVVVIEGGDPFAYGELCEQVQHQFFPNQELRLIDDTQYSYFCMVEDYAG